MSHSWEFFFPNVEFRMGSLDYSTGIETRHPCLLLAVTVFNKPNPNHHHLRYLGRTLPPLPLSHRPQPLSSRYYHMEEPQSPPATDPFDEAEFERIKKKRDKMLRSQARRELRRKALKNRPKVHSFAALIRKRKERRLQGYGGGATGIAEMFDTAEVDAMLDQATDASGEESNHQMEGNGGEVGINDMEAEVNDEAGEVDIEGAGVDTEEAEVGAQQDDEEAEDPQPVDVTNARRNIQVSMPDGSIVVRVRECASLLPFRTLLIDPKSVRRLYEGRDHVYGPKGRSGDDLHHVQAEEEEVFY